MLRSKIMTALYKFQHFLSLEILNFAVGLTEAETPRFQKLHSNHSSLLHN